MLIHFSVSSKENLDTPSQFETQDAIQLIFSISQNPKIKLVDALFLKSVQPSVSSLDKKIKYSF